MPINLTEKETKLIVHLFSQVTVNAMQPEAVETISTIQSILTKLKGEEK